MILYLELTEFEPIVLYTIGIGIFIAYIAYANWFMRRIVVEKNKN